MKRPVRATCPHPVEERFTPIWQRPEIEDLSIADVTMGKGMAVEDGMTTQNAAS